MKLKLLKIGEPLCPHIEIPVSEDWEKEFEKDFTNDYWKDLIKTGVKKEEIKAFIRTEKEKSYEEGKIMGVGVLTPFGEKEARLSTIKEIKEIVEWSRRKYLNVTNNLFDDILSELNKLQ